MFKRLKRLFSMTAENTFSGLSVTVSNDAGQSVTPNTVVTDPKIWRGLNLIARDVARLPLDVFRRDGDSREKDTKHPAYSLLNRVPNTYQTGYKFRELLTLHAIVYGNGFAQIVRQGSGVPVALVPIHPSRVTISLNQVTGNKSYIIDSRTKLMDTDILHIFGLGFDGLRGMGLCEYGAQALGLELAARQFGSLFFAQGSMGSFVIYHPSNLSNTAKKNIVNAVNELHSSNKNAHKAILLSDALKIEPLSINAKDAQLIELRKFSVREIANLLCVPPHKLGDDSSTSFSSLEQENQSYLDQSLDPWMRNWESECWAKLLTEKQKTNDTHFFEFNRGALLRTDLSARFSAYATAITNGWMSRDEVRRRENMNPIPGGKGSEFILPLNMATVDQQQ